MEDKYIRIPIDRLPTLYAIVPEALHSVLADLLADPKTKAHARLSGRFDQIVDSLD